MAALLQRPGSKIFYIQYSIGGKKRRVSTGTDVLQIAKEKLRQFESAQANGSSPLPSRTPIPDVVGAYARFMRSTKTFKSVMTDIYYLRQIFGPVCPELKVTTTRKRSPQKRPVLVDADRRHKLPLIEAKCFEAITSAQVSQFITAHVDARGLAPKTANRYREILLRLFNWARQELGIRTAGNINPVQGVHRRREHAPHIRFLTLDQVDTQLNLLREQTLIQTMVATLIYAGMRREELLWLQVEDLDLSIGSKGIIRVHKKEVDGESWQPKTKVNRAIPVSAALRRYLLAYQPKPSAGHWLFPTGDGKRWNPDVFSETLREFNRQHRLSWSCLDFRHTFGSQLAQKGESLYKIATLMGNSPEICRRHYAALVPEAMCDTVEFPEAKDEAKPATPTVAAKKEPEATNAGDKPATVKDEKADEGAEPKSLRIAG